MRVPAGPMRSTARRDRIVQMRRAAVLFGVFLLMRPVLADPTSIQPARPDRPTYVQYVQNCVGISDPEEAALCMRNVEPNRDDLVSVEPIKYIRWSVRDWVAREGTNSKDTIDAVIRATEKVISEMPDGEISKDLAKAKLLADQIRDRTKFDECAVKNPQYTAGCYTLDPRREALDDPAEGIRLSPDSVRVVCGDKDLGGDDACAATYAHEIAHMLG